MRDVTEQLDEGAPELGFVPLRLASVEDYRLGRELARGGMGQILEADDLRHGRRVALKRPLGAGDAAVHRFVREARMAARLEHPGIVPVYEAASCPRGSRSSP
jgi:serine/threonine protein kinase